MSSSTFLLRCLLPLLLFTSLFASATRSRNGHGWPRRGGIGGPAKSIFRQHPSASSSSSKDLKTYFYNQTLDHFNYGPQSYATFRQKYMINWKYWGGSRVNAPIFVYLGEECPIDEDAPFLGFLPDNAPSFKALLVYIEHRFYGESIPLTSFDKALENATIRGYFNAAQAIEDYAEVLIYLKQRLRAQHSPTVVIGGSYGGMLASWMRLKYPHVVVGALASSAPILYFDDIIPQNGYDSIVTKNFREVSESCYQTIKNSWSEIDRVASSPNGKSVLTKRFKLCKKLDEQEELKDYLEAVYDLAAQYDAPPSYPVSVVCRGIDGAPKGTDTLGQIFSGVLAYLGNRSCYDIDEILDTKSQTGKGWQWQTCSDMVSPSGRNNETMYPPNPFNISAYIEDCKSLYGVEPKPHWVTSYFGGHDIKLTLGRFGSNIIFSNGLRDPWSSGGVLQNISDSIVAVYTHNGSHCLDLDPKNKEDPTWLTAQRKLEVGLMQGWIAQYYKDFNAQKAIDRSHTATSNCSIIHTHAILIMCILVLVFTLC